MQAAGLACATTRAAGAYSWPSRQHPGCAGLCWILGWGRADLGENLGGDGFFAPFLPRPSLNRMNTDRQSTKAQTGHFTPALKSLVGAQASLTARRELSESKMLPCFLFL